MSARRESGGGARSKRPARLLRQSETLPLFDEPAPPPSEQPRGPLVDDEARRIASEDVGRSLLVEAGAGTGKTTLLVDRVLHIIARRGVPIEKIVAITFTEKAAAELRLKVREKLEAAVAGPDAPAESDDVDRWTDLDRERFDAALEHFQLASINTIHAFCASLLRERPVEAGVDPGFAVLDGVSETLLFDDVWQRWEEAHLAAGAVPLARALAAGVTRAALRRTARKALSRREIYDPDAFLPPGTPDLSDELDAYAAQIAVLAAVANAGSRSADDKFLLGLRPMTQLAVLAARADRDEREAILLRCTPPKLGNVGKTSFWKPGALDDARERLERIKERYAAIGAQVAAEIGAFLGGFLAAYADEKRRRGVLDFHDLLLHARDLLRDRRNVRRDFLASAAVLLVDEFQDTDPLQMEIAFFLAEPRAEATSWRETEIAPGRLFIVGDPKQSIYRFRRADIDMYDAAKRRIDEPARLQIVQNFRSVPGITSWVNAAFERLFEESPDVLSQAPFAPIEPYRPARAGVPAVVLLAPPPLLDEQDAESARDLEADAIASALDRILTREWAAPRHTAILLRSMAELAPYEDALEARGIPFQVEGGRAFFERAEVRALLACLAAVEDPEDRIALVAALKSPHFGVSDDTIAQFVASDGQLRYLVDPGSAHPEMREAFATLRELHGRRHDEALHRVVERVLAETQVLELHALRGGGRRAVANLRKVAEKARALGAAGVVTLRGLIRTLDSQSEAEGAAEGDSPIADETADLVRIMTIHAAKGLEFDVVAVANLFGGVGSFAEPFLADGAEARIEFTLGNKESPFRTRGFDALRGVEKLRWRGEERRLLYVAATRARDILVIPGHGALLPRKGRQPLLFRDLESVLPPRERWEHDAHVDGVTVWVMPAEHDARAGRDGGEARAHTTRTAAARLDASVWRETHAQAIAQGSAALPVLPTRPKAVDEAAMASGPPNAVVAARVARARERAVTLGSWVHAILERVPGLDAARIEAAANDVAREHEAPADAAEALAIVRAALAQPALERARRAPRILREVPFSVTIDGLLAEGRIDLVFEEDGDIVFVDYKTDRVEDDARGKRDALRAFAEERGHVQQAAVYARALAVATGRAVREGHLVYARGPAALALTADELASVRLDALEVARLADSGALDD